ncbi:TonB-dependent receptor domain-containing protein [Marinicauda salina]|nr:TonB-dependent receptor [Marinicauda salina]
MIRSTLSLLLLGASAPALAESADDAVIVTGTRFETEAERLPASVSTVERADIELEAVATLSEALADLPGVTVAQSGPAGSLTSVFLRGANSKHTLALLDGIRLNDPASANGIFNFGSELVGDAARVEVVRGPLSSVYGSDAIGGAVNIIPRLGGETAFEPYAEIAVGEFSTVRGLVGAAGSTERARYGLTVEAMETDGYDVTPSRMSTATGDRDGAEFAVLTATGEYDLDGGVTLEGLVRLRSAESEVDTFSGGASGFQRADDPDLVNADDYAVWRMGAAWTSRDGGFTSRLRGGQVLNDLENRDGGVITDTYEGERTFAEWLNVWRPGASGLRDPRVSFGAQYQREDIETDAAFAAPLSVVEEAWGGFVVGQAGLGDRVDLTASARVDDYENFGTETTADIGAVVHLPELRTRLVGSIGSAFKAPTLSERFASSAFITPNPDLEPEESVGWELGFATALPAFGAEDGVRFGATWFDQDIEDLIETEFDFTTFTGQNVNIGEAEIEGFEAFVAIAPSERLDVRVDYTFTDAINAVTGARLLRRPPHAWSASARWRPVERAALSLEYVFVGERRDVTYDDDGVFVASGAVIDAYELVNLSGTFDVTDRIEAFAAAKNVFDETWENPAAFAGAPRRVMVGLRYAR